MNPAFAVTSGVVALLGLGCLWFWRKFRHETALMAATQTSRAADVAALPPGTIVEVTGTIRCEAPLTGEFSKRSCVYYKSEIERERVRWRDGKRETETFTEYNVERHTPFHIEDSSGRVLVRGDGAGFEAVRVLDESGNSTAESLVSLATSLLGQGSSDRRFKESILAPDTPAYVLGTVREGGAIGAAPKGAKNKEFIVTYKSKEERARSSGIAAVVLLVLAVIFLVGAVALLYAAVRYPLS